MPLIPLAFRLVASPATSPSSIYPTCAMDEYASRRFRLFCVRAAKFAAVMVAIETNITMGTYTIRSGCRPPIKIRKSLAQPAALTETDMNPVTAVGAPSVADGDHLV